MKLFNKSKELTAWSTLQMKADKTAELNISGYIGIPEWWQFDPDMEADLISTKEKMQKELKEISNLKVDRIKVYIDSFGGCVNHGQAIYSALKKNPAHIEVEYTGWSASIATIIAASATDNDISMSTTNMILIHQSRGCACGIASVLREYASTMEKVNNKMADIYASQSGKTSAEMHEIMNLNRGDGIWLSADEALEIGLISKITEPLKMAASYDPSVFKQFGYPMPDKLNKLVNMRFGKNKSEPINTMALDDGSILLYEGELKEGVTMQKSGESPDFSLEGEHTNTDGDTITIDSKNEVVSIVEKDDNDGGEGLNAENVTEIVGNVVGELLAEKLEEIEALIESKIEAARKVGSTARVPKIDSPSADNMVDIQAQAKMKAQERAKEIAKNKKARRKGK